MRKNLQPLFNPKSIAIVGASRSQKKLGFIVLKNIITAGYEGHIFPINPEAEFIYQLKCFPTLLDVPVTPELVILAIPAKSVKAELIKVIQKGVKTVVVFAAGFKEIGAEGVALEQQIIDLANVHNLNILGPNCLGFVNNTIGLNATFGEVQKSVGNLRFISQSGAIATSVFDWSNYSDLGFREFITLGNKAVINENDVLEYFRSEKSGHYSGTQSKYLTALTHDRRLAKVSPISMYLESISQGEDFLNIVSQITLKDPVLLLKPGKSAGAQKAMQSHTGSIAGEDQVLDAALQQIGVVRCEGVEDLFDLSKAFSWENVPLGPNVAVISNAGGPGVITADFIEEYGLKLANISPKTTEILEQYLPRTSSFLNPIDVLGDALASRYAYAIDAVLEQPDVHALLVILTPQIMTQIYQTAEYIGRLSDLHKKPIICAFMGGTNIERGERILNAFKIPSFRYPERAVKVLGKMWWWRENALKRSLQIRKMLKGVPVAVSSTAEIHKVNQIINIAQRENRGVLNNFESNEILKSWGVNTPPSAKITSMEDALQFTNDFGWPVVLKLSSRMVLHKTELGGVITNISNRFRLEQALKTMQKRIEKLSPEIQSTCALQLQKQVADGIEVIIGVKKDPNFGHVMLFGAGGTYAEILKDTTLRLLPVDRFDAKKIVEGSKIFKLMNGYRGKKPAALNKLYFLMEKVSELVETFPEIEQFEINPLIVTPEEAYAVDGKFMLDFKNSQ